MKKKVKKKATLKNKAPIDRRTKTMKKMIVSNCSQKQAMLDAGYSAGYAHNPHLLKKTRKWKDIMADKLSDEIISDVHAGLLKASRLEQGSFPLETPDDLIRLLIHETGCLVMKIIEGVGQKHVWYRSPDNNARKAAVDMAYKCKGIYAPEKFEEVNPLAKLSNAELAEKRKILLKFLLKK